MGDFFTRADWRPSKKRKMQKRKKHYAGCKVAPKAFLEAAQRVKIQPGLINRRLCGKTTNAGHPCRNLALHDMNACGYHGGYKTWARLKKLQPTGAANARRAAQKAALTNQPKTPKDLVSLKEYQQANQQDRQRMQEAFASQSWPNLIRQLHQRLPISAL